MIRSYLSKMRPSVMHRKLLQEIEKSAVLTGNQLSRIVRSSEFLDLHEAEFRVFSQFGEDGIIQYLLGKVTVEEEFFVEFGVESYEESNTRFLLIQDNWRGAIFDGGKAHLSFLEKSHLIWRHDIRAASKFITRENINEIFAELQVPANLGLLSVDLDGIDYWVLEALRGYSPTILIAEYNALWGSNHSVTVPYDSGFMRTNAHYSNLYFGASLSALTAAAKKLGMSLVCCTKAGNNAFFVRNEFMGSLKAMAPEEAYVEARFRESRGPNSELTLLNKRAEKLALLSGLPLFDLRTGKAETIGTLFQAELSSS